MSSAELVSAVIPTYYRNDDLRGAIESVQAQTYDPIEIVVVDDSGERHAEPVSDEYDIAYVAHEENRGGNPARNTGIGRARGKYVQLLDDDDRICPEKISKQVSLLESSSGVGVAYTGIEKRNGHRVFPNESDADDSLRSALQFGVRGAVTSSLLISNEVLSDIHPLTTRKAADDVGFKIELAKRTDFGYVNEVLVALGDSDERRSSSLDVIDELQNIMAEYDELYDRYPAYVRNNARSYIYTQKGHLLLEKQVWSLEAIACFARSLYYRGFNFRSVAAVLLSLFGSPGVEIGEYLIKIFKFER